MRFKKWFEDTQPTQPPMRQPTTIRPLQQQMVQQPNAMQPNAMQQQNSQQFVIADGGGKVSIQSPVGEVAASRSQGDPNLYIVESSQSTQKGAGPMLYDLLMEYITNKGGYLCSDRKTVSPAAKKVWDFYYFKRPDVEKVEINPGLWYMGHLAEPYFQSMTEDQSTWPPKQDPIWSLWTAYRKKAEKLPTLLQSGQLQVRQAGAGHQMGV